MMLKIVFLVLIGATFSYSKISDKRLCYDVDCNVVISEGKTTIPYHSNDDQILSFLSNADVKIYSKGAGSREDLWGVEISGKRGYIPSLFVKELKVYYNNALLTNLLPTEDFHHQETQINNQNSEEFIDNKTNSIPKIENEKEIPVNEFNLSQADSIIPHKVSPSYETIDGTVLPVQEDIEPLPPSYSTISLQEKKEKEKVVEEVTSDLYSKILSPLTAISDYINGGDDDEDLDDEDEVKESEKTVVEEVAEETPEIKKADESSLSVKQKDAVATESAESNNEIKTKSNENTSKEGIIEVIVSNEPLETSSKEIINDNAKDNLKPLQANNFSNNNTLEIDNKEIISNIETEKVDQPEINDFKNINNLEIDNQQNTNKIETESLKQSDVKNVINTNKVPTFQPQKIVSEVSKNNAHNDFNIVNEASSLQSEEKITEDKSSKKDAVIKIVEINVKQELNDAAEVIKNVEIDNSNNNVTNESNESLSSVDVSNKDSSKSDVIEETEPVSNELLNDTVPKQEEKVIVTNDSVTTKNEVIATASAGETILDNKKINENDTSVNSTSVDDSITPKVPLNQVVKEDLIIPPNQPFLSHNEPFQPNLSEIENVSIPITGEKLTAPDTFNQESTIINNSLNNKDQLDNNENVEDINNNLVEESSYTSSIPAYLHNDSAIENTEPSFQSADSSREHIVDIPSSPTFGDYLGNRNLLNAGKGFQHNDYSEEIGVDKVVIEESVQSTNFGSDENHSSEVVKQEQVSVSFEEVPPASPVEKIVIPPDTCDKNYESSSDHEKEKYFADGNAVTSSRKVESSSETLLYVCITAVTTLLFSLGYYLIENKRRDAYLIAKINNLERDLMITRKECIMLDENFKSTKTKLDSIEDESFGSNEMVLSLKTDLVASENARAELKEQIASLEKELESTSEAGLELERMLREILSTQSEENNPLARSIEDLQDRLNDQQVANETLMNALAVKTQQNETLTADLKISLEKVEELQAEVFTLSEELKTQTSTKLHLERSMTDQLHKLELQLKSLAEDKSNLRKQLKVKELEVKELLGVVEQLNANNLDFDKFYEVSQIKAEAAHLLEERDELKIKLSEEEGAHQLLEEHVKLVKEEIAFLSEQCKVAEKDKKEAETRLEVLTKFFEDKETQRQKEEAIWLEKQGEVSSTVERLHTMQNEILNYKQQIEMLRREILDQEREYKNQISALETKAHEQWVAARQNERRLEEVKAESSQLRNRLTLAEKNINDPDPESKLHRLQGANGETGNAHSLFVGGETSSSPLLFGGGPPPPLPPPSYLSFHPPIPFIPPPPVELASRPPPLGAGRLSSPPPATGTGAGSPPLIPFMHPPPLPPFASDVLRHMPPPYHHPGDNNTWGDDTPARNTGYHRPRNHKGSLHSSGESLDKSHHSGKV